MDFEVFPTASDDKVGVLRGKLEVGKHGEQRTGNLQTQHDDCWVEWQEKRKTERYKRKQKVEA